MSLFIEIPHKKSALLAADALHLSIFCIANVAAFNNRTFIEEVRLKSS